MKLNTRKLEILIAESGMTTAVLAEKSGVSRASISNIKNGKSCNPITADKLAKALGVPLAEIAE